ncbi:MAG: hypothetical protein WDW36_010343 [Sanguina aurantia]
MGYQSSAADVVEALIREYLVKHSCKDTSSCFSREKPKHGQSISRREHLRAALGLEGLVRAAKSGAGPAGDPHLGTTLEIWVADQMSQINNFRPEEPTEAPRDRRASGAARQSSSSREEHDSASVPEPPARSAAGRHPSSRAPSSTHSTANPQPHAEGAPPSGPPPFTRPALAVPSAQTLPSYGRGPAYSTPLPPAPPSPSFGAAGGARAPSSGYSSGRPSGPPVNRHAAIDVCVEEEDDDDDGHSYPARPAPTPSNPHRSASSSLPYSFPLPTTSVQPLPNPHSAPQPPRPHMATPSFDRDALRDPLSSAHSRPPPPNAPIQLRSNAGQHSPYAVSSVDLSSGSRGSNLDLGSGSRSSFPSASSSSRNGSSQQQQQQQQQRQRPSGAVMQMEDCDFGDDFGSGAAIEHLSMGPVVIGRGANAKATSKGAPLSQELRRSVSALLWGSQGGPPPSWHQGFFFSSCTGLGFGLLQTAGGPCGVLAAVQAHVLAGLQSTDGSFNTSPTASQQQRALASALSELLWACRSGPNATLVLPTSEAGEAGAGPPSTSYDRLSRAAAAHSVASLGELQLITAAAGPWGPPLTGHQLLTREPLRLGSLTPATPVHARLRALSRPPGMGAPHLLLPPCCTSPAPLLAFAPVGSWLLFPAVCPPQGTALVPGPVQPVGVDAPARLGHLPAADVAAGHAGVATIVGEMDERENALLGMHGYCTQELVNLILTGRAVSNVFDGVRDLGETKLRGIGAPCKLGMLTLFEWYKYVEVGTFLKNPSLPVWVVCSESHFTVLFGLDARCTSRRPFPFDLIFYDELANQEAPVRLTVDHDPRGGWTGKVGETIGDRGKCEGQNIPPLECVIETRWPGVRVNWNGADPIL